MTTIIEADLSDPTHAAAIVDLIAQLSDWITPTRFMELRL